MKVLLFMTCLCYANIVYGQNIKGKVVDAQHRPLPYVSCMLQAADSTNISGTVSDVHGSFVLPVREEREYIVQLSYLGYETYSVRCKAGDLGTIVLKEDLQMVDEVVVVGEKPLTSLTEDGNIRFNISQLKSKTGADITAILNKLPGVSANQKQGLTLNGQSATLYIDGKKQPLSGSQAINLLKTMPVEAVDNVELNAYTGSSYDAATGPVINIVTSRRKDNGWNLSVSGAGSVDRNNLWEGGGNGFVVARSGNVNIYGMLDYYNGVTSYIRRDSTVYNSINYLLENRNLRNRGNTYSGMANVEWMIKPEHTLTFNLYAYKELLNSAQTDRTTGSMEQNRSSAVKDGRANDDLYTGTIEYAVDFDESLKLKVNYGLNYGSTGTKDSYLTADDVAGMQQPSLSTHLQTRGTQHILKGDLTKRFSKTLLSVGLKADIGNLNNKVAYRGNTPSWIEPLSRFEAQERIYAVYASVNHKFGKRFSFNTGVRGELTDYKTENRTIGAEARNSYFNFFPSLNVTHRAKNIRQTLYFISAIRRPDYSYLYPGKQYESEYAYTSGNPTLKPTKAWSVKYVGYYWTYARFSLGFQRDRDLSARILQLQDDRITAYSYLNYADRKYWFAEFTIPFACFKRKLYGNVEIEVNHTELDHFKNGYRWPYANRGFWNTKISGFVQYDVTDRLSFNGQFAYYPKRKTAQYRQQSYWWLDLGVDYYLNRNKSWLLSLSVEDVANKLDYRQTYFYSDATKFRHLKSGTQLVRFRLTWKFGGGKKLDAEPKSIGNDVSRFRNKITSAGSMSGGGKILMIKIC